MYNLIIIGGNPGSGKTTISVLLEQQGFVRLGIDDMYQQAPRDPQIEHWFEDRAFLDAAYALFREHILKALQDKKRIVIETTGVSKRWTDLFAELQATFRNQIITIYLETSLETSAQRIEERNKTTYPFKMTKERLDAFFTLGKETSNAYQHVIDANRPLNEVFSEVMTLLA